MEAIPWLLLVTPFCLLAVAGSGWLYGRLRPAKVREWSEKQASPDFPPIGGPKAVAVVIACFRGAGTIGETVRAALLTGCDVYVIDDGSKQKDPADQTSEAARAAGAVVLELVKNGGKPKALYTAFHQLDLSTRYDAVAILDDDVLIEPDFIERSLEKMTDLSVAIAVGKNITWWPKEHRWNVWLAKRAFSYWNFQLTIRHVQSLFGVMNCISGSNSVYRSSLLEQVLVEKTPYIVDDTYWVLEAQRRNLGKVVYAPRARAHLQDPTNFKDWYSQNLRWLWGTFQGIIGHRVGRQASRFDAAYILLMLHWTIYIVSAPVAVGVLVVAAYQAPIFILVFFAGYSFWIVAASIGLRQPRLLVFIVPIIITDFIYRWLFVHALIKAVRQPTVENCVWTSPARITTA
ncbi:glycosyltransferase [Agrococcus citreus]|uniref:Glycosyltransferase family 2 protein n=1 Tax=Agrococcus citreus TaxID=84643 RepID=A0ABN1YRJ3_9MICO